jgi:hypothetical protein
MAIAPPPARPNPNAEGGPLLHIVLPLLGFIALTLALLAGLAYAVILFQWPSVLGLPADTEPTLRRVAEPVRLAGTEVTGAVWWLVLVPVLLLGFFYVLRLYRRDAGAVGGAWSLFLGLCRCTVYLILAGVFLLPAYQHWEETHSQSRDVLAIDVTPSVTDTRDGAPTDETPVEKLPTRQDQVIQLLTSGQPNFLRRLEERNPVFAYRFGRMADEGYHVFADGQHWSREDWEDRARPHTDEKPAADAKPWGPNEWRAWLRPDLKARPPDDATDEERDAFRKKLDLLQRHFSGTNVADSLLTVLNREANNMVQGLVVFSDGHSTEGSDRAYRELAERAQRAKVPIFVVAVGEDRPQIRIDITDLRVPDQVRPEDKFKVVAEVNGEGLADQECDVTLDVFRPSKEKAATLRPKAPVKFRPGEPPHATAEFEIDPAAFALAKPGDKGKKPELEEGEWSFVARVPKARREMFLKKEHVTDPARMLVIKRPLRVLIFAGGTMRDYQFLRTMLVREMDKKRVEVSIYLQPAPGQAQRRAGIVQDVPSDRLLTQFPFKLQDESADKADERLYNLGAYDLIVAFDPDWTQLAPDQLTVLERWVGTHAGGLIVVGGPVNTLQLARPGTNAVKLKPVLDLYPVVLQDSRIQEIERNATEPWRLHFPGATQEMEFLKLDEDPGKDLLAGWEEFFTGNSQGGKTIKRGFYNYYPVEKAKEGATIVATFADPRARLADGKEQPWIVTMPYGSGKVVWLGAGELWRLREYKQEYLERFWTKLCRYVGSGNTGRLNRRIIPVMGRKFKANSYVSVEAQIFGRDLLPLPANVKERPVVQVRPPSTSGEKVPPVELAPEPSQGEWNGRFSARFLVRQPGEYGYDIKVPDTGDSLSGKFSVVEVDPETDDTRPDFAALYSLASDASDVLARVDEDTQRRLKAALQAARPVLSQAEQQSPRSEAEQTKDAPRLYFTLQNAELIPSCMITARKEAKNRGAVVDLWDKGPSADLNAVSWALLASIGGLLLLTFVAVGLTVVSLARGRGAEYLNYVLLTVVLLAALVPLYFVLRWLDKPVMFSAVLVVAVGLLGVEWLCRKLLRLA